MEKKQWKLVNSQNVKPYVCGPEYSSRMLTGDEMAGFPVININEGTLQPKTRTGGGAHEETEIYYIVRCADNTFVWLDDDCLPVKPGDVIIIPPHVFHWIDNTQSDSPFVLFTVWPRQEQNELYHIRQKAWNTCVADLDPEYIKKRMNKKQA